MDKISLHLVVNSNLYLRDPLQTELGRKIIQHSVIMIDVHGIEQFTFKKLASEIGSTEASIYRYFDNKHRLVVYLINWYWEWVKFRIQLQTMNVHDPLTKMKIVLRIIVDSSKRHMETPYVNEDILHKIVVREGIKAYHSKTVDEENEEGYFLAYKALCSTLADIVLEINPHFKYPRAFASMLIETANNNIYFAQHLPRLTDIDARVDDLNEAVIEMLECFVFNIIDQAPSSKLTFQSPNGLKIQANRPLWPQAENHLR